MVASSEEAPPEGVFPNGSLTEPNPARAFEVEEDVSTESQPGIMITEQNTVTGRIEATALTGTYEMEGISRRIRWPEIEVSSAP